MKKYSKECLSFEYDLEKNVCYRNLGFLGFEEYKIGDDGSLWSKWVRSSKKGTKNRWKISKCWQKLRPSPHKDGHLSVSLSGNNPRKRFQIHRLVLFAFVGISSEKKVSRHFPDRDPKNNRLENLRWGTKSENSKDAVRDGTCHLLGHSYATGEKNYNAKLNQQKVKEIRLLGESKNYTHREIAAKTGISHSVVTNVINRKAWSWVK